MDRAGIGEAARLLADARLGLERFERLPPDLAPQNEDEAYAVQDALNERLEAAFGPRVGCKIGCTTATMQRYLNIPEPCAGEMFARAVFRGDTRLPHACFVRPGDECELAVELARPLRAADGPADRHRAAAAIGAAMLSIEIVDDRYADWRSLDVHTLIADDFFNAGCVLGEPLPWRPDLDLGKIQGRMRLDHTIVGEGTGADILGHPLDALVWLARRWAALGRDLAAGTVVTLGSLVQTHWVERGALVEIEADGLGRVAVAFD
ncbi:MAG TPA: fumarylacetoacetate hydrolase family protein [Geminicoccaceae bacterium]|nr:fumarylacetoacetate hydrolase family protein [Geminicoccaceae bacterium]